MPNMLHKAAKRCNIAILFICFSLNIDDAFGGAKSELHVARSPDVQELFSRRRSGNAFLGRKQKAIHSSSYNAPDGADSRLFGNEVHGFLDHENILPIRLHHKTGEPVSHGRHYRSRRTYWTERNNGGSSPHPRRRYTNQSPKTTRNVEYNDYAVANFSISAFGEKFLLHLTPYSKFIAPTFTLHYMGNITNEVDDNFEDTPRHCFYSGIVNSRPDHTAVLSVCGGLYGSFRTDTKDYLIQPHEFSESSPYPSENFDEEGAKPHRIFRRSRATKNTEDKTQKLCDFIDKPSNQVDRAAQPAPFQDIASDIENIIAKTQTDSKMSLLTKSRHAESSRVETQGEATKQHNFLDWLIAIRLNKTLNGKLKHLRNISLISSTTTEKPAEKWSWKNMQNLVFESHGVLNSRRLRLLYSKLRATSRISLGKTVAAANPYPKLDGRGKKSKSRKKRYLSYPRNVEVMVTADNKMHRSHGANLQHYVLTLVAIVHHIYLDASIENLINIVLVKLIVIGDTDEAQGPRITKDAHDCLRNFCQWQAEENDPDDSHPNHHDTAVLITRQDICRSETACDTLGLAELGTMCDPLRSCSINEDNGLSTAFTIAHEIGHEFNAPHDNNEKCISPDGKPGSMHVMSPTLDHKSKPWSWSRCSAKYITNFLDYGNGQCLLDDPPQRVLPLPMEEPGQIYDVNQQCSFVYGGGVTHCGFMTTCVRLWCVSADRRHGCRTPHMPWADGTKCAPGKWCQRGKCVVENQHRRPIDGDWGEWSKFGECSRTCGGGIRISQRQCDNPTPQDGGRFCVGKRKKFRSCNWQECSVARDFRAEQCAAYGWSRYNRHQIRGVPANALWIPKYNGILLQDRCKLVCQVKRTDQYGAPWYVLKPKVSNGTPCGPDTNDICVEGICKRAGCDHVLNSNTRLDECGVCGGDNSGCRTIKGVYNVGNSNGYTIVAEIPKGATNIVIEQRSYELNSEDNNYLALKDSVGNFILNGNRNVVQFEQAVMKRSPTGNGYAYYFDYTGTDKITERINSTRPIMENVTVLVLSAGELAPPNIRYKYNIPMPEHTTYMWDPYGQWSPCTRPCHGRTKRKVLCVRSGDRQVVADHKCHSTSKPASIIRSCQTDCDIKWRMKSSECSARCGKGVASSTYECIKITRSLGPQSHVETLPDKDCLSPKPSTRAVCHGECLATQWVYGDWAECTRTCGGGTQTRTAECRDSNDVHAPSTECYANERLVSRICHDFPCPRWVTSDFSTCLATCGHGVRRRRVWCRGSNGDVHNGITCDPISKPPSTIRCVLQPCPKWEYGDWGKCSATCGVGETMRVMRCIDYLGRHVDDDQCSEGLREKDTKSCSSSAPCYRPSYFPPSRSAQPILIVKGRLREENNEGNIDASANTGAGLILDVRDNRRRQIDKAPNARSNNINSGSQDLQVGRAQWRMGHWTECTATCGQGARERYVSCRHDDGYEVGDADCVASERRPADKETCENAPCGGMWRTGVWTECPVSCGEGVRTRYVQCVFDGRYDNDLWCRDTPKPETVQTCVANMTCTPTDSRWGNDASVTPRTVLSHIVHATSETPNIEEIPVSVVTSNAWRTGPWSDCSSSCGSGNKKRAVVCHGKCEMFLKPAVIRLCESGPCPKWRDGNWSECSVSCGRGVKNREVHCVMGEEITDDSRCDILTRPLDAVACDELSCVGHGYRWRTTHWSGCSVSCGRGTKQRKIICTGAKRHAVSNNFCDDLLGKKPAAIRKCRTRRRCPKWHTGRWNKCSTACGRGVRVRGVHCRYKRKTMDDNFCDVMTKPEDVESCDGNRCGYYKWIATAWTSCSATCGYGTMNRIVTCVDGQHARMADSACTAGSKPSSSQHCGRKLCESYWHTEPWSECSQTCGRGLETRQVLCVHLNRETYRLLPASNCDSQQQPYSFRDCFLNSCEPETHWRVGPWNECSTSCGEGVSERLVLCYTRAGQRAIRNVACETMGTPKPESSRKCNLVPCAPTTCRHVQVQHGEETDGEYYLLVKGKIRKIYCGGMNTLHPTEYITLPSGPEDNFSEIYGYSLNNSETCPHNGTRNDECACTRNPQAGKTRFHKIRLEVRSMKVIVSDFTFASTEYGRPLAFGVAGDCYSRANCPQGKFHINLSGTGFAVTSSTQWSSYGRSAIQTIERSKDGVTISGACGGYCGQCRSDPINGLILKHSPRR